MKKVKVYDEIMGSGKTYDAIERMKGYLKKGVKFIYITPFLDENVRVLNDLPIGKVFTPLSREELNGKEGYEVLVSFLNEKGLIDLNSFEDKKKFKRLNKRAQFLKFVSQGKNIVSTHQLFMGLKAEDFNLFSDYILILDEVVNPLEIKNIGATDIQILRDANLIFIEENTSRVRFIDDDYRDPAFKSVKELCNNSTVYYLDKYFFVWVFPIEIFMNFKEVQILTYIFEASLLSAYFKMYDVKYELRIKDSTSKLEEIKELLNIYEGKANSIEGLNTSFSKTWVENLSKSNAKKITESVSNLFKRSFKTKSIENAFTTFKDDKSKFKGKGYAKGFISINARSTNDFRHKKSMAYFGNRFFKPQQISFFNERNIQLNQDLWALSELIQWIWRGCIRDSKRMNLYIPSERMRSLMYDWLEGRFNDSIIGSQGKFTSLKEFN